MLVRKKPRSRKTEVTELSLSAFDERWLAEAIRLRETHAGPLEDAAAVRSARGVRGDFEARVRQRAIALSKGPDGMLEALQRWSARGTLAGLAIAAFALVAGSGMAAAVLGDGSRPVNVVWALGTLLGVHLITLVMWLLAGMFHRKDGGSLVGRLWVSATAAAGRRHGEAWLLQARLEITRQAGALFVWLGRISHGVWLLTLASALVTLLVMLSTRRYGFIWETTILPAEVITRLAEVLAWLPRQFGLTMPDTQMVLRAAGPDAVDADRHVWSAWLISALVLYGVVPRALLWLGCNWLWRRARRRHRLDLTQPAYARLKRRLMPEAESTGVSDAAPAHLPQFHADRGAAVPDDGRLALALELGSDLVWPPAGLPPKRDGGRPDSRADRRATLDRLAAHPVERLLIAIDPRLSPDRGSLAAIAELSRYAHSCGIWFFTDRGDAERRQHWRDALLALGIAPAALFATAPDALGWLKENADD